MTILYKIVFEQQDGREVAQLRQCHRPLVKGMNGTSFQSCMANPLLSWAWERGGHARILHIHPLQLPTYHIGLAVVLSCHRRKKKSVVLITGASCAVSPSSLTILAWLVDATSVPLHSWQSIWLRYTLWYADLAYPWPPAGWWSQMHPE